MYLPVLPLIYVEEVGRYAYPSLNRHTDPGYYEAGIQYGMHHTGMHHTGIDHTGMDRTGMDHTGMDHPGISFILLHSEFRHF